MDEKKGQDTAKRLLLVDDDRIALLALSKLAAVLGYAVAGTADRPADALAKAGSLSPDLVLLDLCMPDPADGLALCAAIQENLGIPVVFVTGHRDESFISGAVGVKPYGLVFKPVDKVQLRIAVEGALRHRAEERLAEQVKTLECLQGLSGLMESPVMTLPAILAGAVELVGAAMRFSDGLGVAVTLRGDIYASPGFFRTDCGMRVAIMVNGREAGQIEAAYAKKPPCGPDGVFLPNEKQLLFAVAGRLGQYVERVEAQAALSASEARFRAVFEQAAVGISRQGRDGRYLEANDRFCRMVGRSMAELSGLTFLDITHPDDRPADNAAMHKLLRGDLAAYAKEKRYLRPDGGEVWCQVNVSAVRGPSGRREYMLAVAVDITERKRAERDLEESREVLSRILDGIAAGIFIIDPETGTVVDMNPAAEAMAGRGREELVHRRCTAIGWRDKAGREIKDCPLDDRALVNEEMRLVRPDGRTVPVVKTVIRTAFRGRELLYEIVFDISARKALERQLAVAQKLESVGELAAGIAHEINTPTQYIGDNLHYLKGAFTDLRRVTELCERLAGEVEAGREAAGLVRELEAAKADMDLPFLLEETPKALDQSLEGVSRVSAIVSAMKKFSHPGGEEKTAMDVNAAVENTVTVARNEWKYVADLDMRLDRTLPPVLCLPGDFNQVILNLLLNAAQAVAEKVAGSGGKGRITVSTERDGDHCKLSVADSGIGIPEANRQKIFDPFFTTKEVGKGTGQGLAIAHNIIVEKHGGTIDFESEPGAGTTFVIRVPFTPEDA